MADNTCTKCQSTHCANPDDCTGHLLARDVMQCGVVSIDKYESVQKAVLTLIERNISGLPVTHEGRIVGMLSEKDLLELLYEASYLPGLVEEYMTTDVTSFGVEDKLSDIQQHLVENTFRRVPILYQDKIAGIITRADLVRIHKEKFRPVTDDESEGRHEVLAEDVMKFGLLTVGPDAPLYDAMDMIVRHHITGLPVVDHGMNLLGVITEKDLLDCINNPDAIGRTVADFMTRDVVTFDRKASLHEICSCLIKNSFHRVPILDGTRLVGIIARSDILKHRAAVFKKLDRVARHAHTPEAAGK
jgi:CBS domain-containing protein